ncbi:MAG: TIM barrel protein, partial [Anaerolineae bacterium]|nr:TIM barrel protein [Anaerolineae bacterium]
LCCDSGHANIGGDRMDRLEPLKDRLLAVHLHDNDGASDQHNLPFDGTIDWSRLARLIAESSYAKCVNLEVKIHNTGIEEEPIFLQKAFETGTTLTSMIEKYRT